MSSLAARASELFHFAAKLEIAVVSGIGHALREYLHGGGGVLQILAHPDHLFSGLIPIVAEFAAQGSLHGVVVLGCGSLAALRIQQLQPLAEIFGAVRIQLHRVFRVRFDRQAVTLGQRLLQFLQTFQFRRRFAQRDHRPGLFS